MSMRRMFVDAATFTRFDAAYSADRIAEDKPVKVAVFKGRLYTSTGMILGGGRGTVIDARRLVPLKEWSGAKPQKRVGSRVRGDRFYAGMRVRHGGADYVLGPERVEIRSRKQRPR